jgi:hypothetical protein
VIAAARGLLACDRSGANAVGGQQGFSPVIAASLAALSLVHVFLLVFFFFGDTRF